MSKRKYTLQGISRFLSLQYGKKKITLKIDLADAIAKGLEISKSEAKRNIEQGALDIINLDIEEVIKNNE